MSTTELREAWTALFTEPCPDDGQWSLWLLLHDSGTVKQGIAQLAAKYRKPWPICLGILAATMVNHALAGECEWTTHGSTLGNK